MTDRELRERLGSRSDLADLAPYRAPQLELPIRLNTNESPYPPPSSFITELQQRVSQTSLHLYPSRDFPEVRDALAVYLNTLSDRLWMANGSNEILLQLLLAFGGPDRKVMTFEPTYAMHTHLTRVTGTRHLRARRNPDYTMHPEASLDAIRTLSPDIVFLCSPNNPTGNANTEEEIGQICSAARGLVILDEAYAEFAPRRHGGLIEEFENLVVTRSFSKAWRLAGARLGYMIASPWVIEEVMKVRLPYHLSALSQAAALTALNHSAEMLSTVSTIMHERDRLYRELSTTRGIVAFPSDANFILFRCEARPAAEIWEGLVEAGILVRDFSDVAGCEECLRVSVGTPEHDEKFLETLSQLIHK